MIWWFAKKQIIVEFKATIMKAEHGTYMEVEK